MSEQKFAVGDAVIVEAYGREYRGTVTYVGPRGAVWAGFTAKNGKPKTLKFTVRAIEGGWAGIRKAGRFS